MTYDIYTDPAISIVESIINEDKDYKAFFKAALKKFGVSNPSELDKGEKKKFFLYIDKNWKGKNEDAEDCDDCGKCEKCDSMKKEAADIKEAVVGLDKGIKGLKELQSKTVSAALSVDNRQGKKVDDMFDKLIKMLEDLNKK